MKFSPLFFRTLLAFISLTAKLLFAGNCTVLVKNTKNIPASTSQVIVVNAFTGIQAEMTACQRQGQGWKQVLKSSFRAVIGKNGLAALGEKKEGDLKTPTGLYALGEAFGSQPLALKMDYRYLTADDKYIDDINSKSYNKWIIGKTKAKSYENMLIEPYKMGIVINYNKSPIIPGAGSAIFMHLWRSSTTPTHGCIATDERHLLAILRWLDKNQHPYIFIN